MGIDVYLTWENQTDDEVKAQYTGFNTWCGDKGYLREAYHGTPYATKVLLPECFEAQGDANISAKVLRERLPDVLKTARERIQRLYRIDPDSEDGKKTLKSFEDFVDLAEQKEKETGKPCTIVVSA